MNTKEFTDIVKENNELSDVNAKLVADNRELLRTINTISGMYDGKIEDLETDVKRVTNNLDKADDIISDQARSISSYKDTISSMSAKICDLQGEAFKDDRLRDKIVVLEGINKKLHDVVMASSKVETVVEYVDKEGYVSYEDIGVALAMLSKYEIYSIANVKAIVDDRNSALTLLTDKLEDDKDVKKLINNINSSNGVISFDEAGNVRHIIGNTEKKFNNAIRNAKHLTVVDSFIRKIGGDFKKYYRDLV